MIQAIIFDLGGVLFTNGTTLFRREISKKYGIAEEEIGAFLEGKQATLYREGKMDRDTFWQSFMQTFQIQEDSRMLENQWIAQYTLISGMEDIVMTLAKQSDVYYLSDTVSERVTRLDAQYNFLQWFRDGIFSHEVGIRKPDPRIYALLLQRINKQPTETVFIDDKEKNLLPAATLGMKTVLFKNPRQLRQKLKNLALL